MKNLKSTPAEVHDRIMKSAKPSDVSPAEYNEFHEQLRERVKRILDPKTTNKPGSQRAIGKINGLKYSISENNKQFILDVYADCKKNINWDDYSEDLLRQWNEQVEIADKILNS